MECWKETGINGSEEIFNLGGILIYKIFTTKECPKCKILKEKLINMDLDFEEIDMTKSESLAELYSNGIFTMSAPVLQNGDKFYTVKELFDGNNLRSIPCL